MQRKKFFSILTALVLLGALIFFNDALGVKNYVFGIITPFLQKIAGARDFILDQDKERILEENKRLKSLAFELELLRVENSSLKKVLSFVEETKLELKGARVLFLSQTSGKEFLIVDRGKEAGIERGDLAVDGDLIFIGSVKEIGDGFAKIGVASNPGETFEVELISSQIKALARGLGAGALAIELLPLDAPLLKGDFVGLLGKERFLPLAEIIAERVVGGSAVKEARAVSLVRPESAREVFIISNQTPR